MSLSRCALALSCLLLACGRSTRDVVVELELPGPDGVTAPLAGQPIIALPYDRDSLIAVLEAHANPRPHAATLDSLYDRFLPPYREVNRLGLAVRAQETEVHQLRSELDSLGRGTPEYARAFGRERQASDSLAGLRRALEKARMELLATRRQLQPRIDSMRVAVRAWEDRTYAGYDTLTTNLAESRLATPAMDTTDASGRARFTLPAGNWWIYARAWHATDPNREWYWNVRVVQDTIRLNTQTGSQRSRY